MAIEPPNSAQVVIIGAGIIGCSTAYHLAQAGVTDVLLLEMATPGAGSSSKSASMLSLQFGSDPLLARLARYSYNRYMEFQEELASSTGFKRSGWLTLADHEHEADLRQHAANLESADIPTELLSRSDVARLYPELVYPGLSLGAFGPEDGSLDAHQVLWGYLKAARSSGIQLLEGTKATGLIIRSGRVEGVRITSGKVNTACVVNAAGPWAAEVAAWAGITLPLRNLNRTIVVTDPVDQIDHGRPFLDIPELGWYGRPEMAGFLMGMGTSPARSLDPALDKEMVGQIIEIGMRILPPLQQASLQSAWTGVRPMTVDGRPILGPVTGLEGLMLNAGWGGMGIIQAPAAGAMLADLIRGGKDPIFDVSPFLLDRFLSPPSQVGATA